VEVVKKVKRSVLLVSSFLLVGSLFSEIFTIRAADDIVWKKELLGKATAYISVAEDIEMARATNAVKRQVGKSVGVDFPKMNVITEYQEEAKKLFETNDESWLFANKTGEYLAYIFNNNTDGTLSDYLIKQGLSDSGISAQATANVSRNRGSFTFYVALTEKGLKEKENIISLIFQQIDKVKKQGIQENYFNEVRESLKQEFAHLQVEKNGNYIEALAEQMLFYPLEHILDADYLVENMDKKAIEEKLSEMNIDNARILLVSDDVETDKKSPYFEAGFSIEKISDEQKKAWLDFSKNPEIKLPELNPYFTTDFSLIKEDKRILPKLIEEGKGTQLYAMPSQYFANDPKARIAVNFSITPRTDSLKESISATILSYMNELAQAKVDFQSSVAGMEAGLSLIENGFSLRAEGYTQHLAQLMQDKMQQFSQFELNEKYLLFLEIYFIFAKV